MVFPSSTSLEMLNAHIMRLEIELAEWKQHRNGRLPIAKLPQEVLCNIFAKAWKPRHSHIPFGVAAGQVCSRWRALVYESPLLWADIQVHRNTRFSVLDHMLKSSKGVTISLDILQIPEWDPSAMRLLGETVRTESTRFRTLSIVGHEPALSQVFAGPFSNPHSRLETLEATGMDRTTMALNSGLQCISAPNIRRVKLGHLARCATVVVPWTSTLFAQCGNLTHLRAVHTPEAGSVRDLKQLLRTVPQLQELFLLFDNPCRRPFALEEFNGAPAPAKANPIHMPCLRVLHLESRSEWTPAAMLLDGMRVDMETLETFSLMPGVANFVNGLNVEQWWAVLGRCIGDAGSCAPEVVHLSSKENRIEAWRKVPDASRERSRPWVLGDEDVGAYGDHDSPRLGFVGAVPGRWLARRKVLPWIALDGPPCMLFDGLSYHGAWSFSNLKVIEFGKGFSGRLSETIEREAPHVEAIIIKSAWACGEFYSILQELLENGTRRPYGELKKLSLMSPRELASSVYGMHRASGRCWQRRRIMESPFQLPQRYWTSNFDAQWQRQSFVPSQGPPGPQPLLFQPLEHDDVEHEVTSILREEGEFLLDFTDILWERKKRETLVENDYGGGELMLDTLEFVGFAQDVHEEVRRMILDSGIAREVVFFCMY